jgi:hypothetical protein
MIKSFTMGISTAGRIPRGVLFWKGEKGGSDILTPVPEAKISTLPSGSLLAVFIDVS